MDVQGRRAEDIDQFMDKLEATGAFHDIVPCDAGSAPRTACSDAAIESVYTPAAG